MKYFDEAVPEFVLEMDKALKCFDLNFGSQWESLDLKRLGVG